MNHPRMPVGFLALAALQILAGGAEAQSSNKGSMHSASSGSARGGTGGATAVVGDCWNGPIIYNPTLYPVWTPYGPGVLLPPPLIVIAPGGGFYYPVPTPAPLLPDVVGQAGGLRLPLPPPDFDPTPVPVRPQVRRVSLTRGQELMTMGERLFRARNFKKAEERFEQAIEANPNSATPHVRLAQVAINRGDYKKAADSFRDAHTAEPNWLVGAGDIMTMYGEPSDFHKRIEALESHLRVNPADRDAWLVLGAQKFLSGKVRQSADIFRRLNDRKADPTLAAFLDATKPDPTRP